MLVAEQDGLVHVLAPDGGDASTLIDLLELVDATSGREGLLSVALDPAFEANGYLWAYYFATGEPARTVLARFDVAEDRGDAASAVVVLEVPQPGGNQNGGAIRFGPDGMLYLGLGDGSASFDPFENGQDLTNAARRHRAPRCQRDVRGDAVPRASRQPVRRRRGCAR